MTNIEAVIRELRNRGWSDPTIETGASAWWGADHKFIGVREDQEGILAPVTVGFQSDPLSLALDCIGIMTLDQIVYVLTTLRSQLIDAPATPTQNVHDYPDDASDPIRWVRALNAAFGSTFKEELLAEWFVQFERRRRPVPASTPTRDWIAANTRPYVPPI